MIMKLKKTVVYYSFLILLLALFVAWLPAHDTKEVRSNEAALLIEKATLLRGNKPQEAMQMAQKALKISLENKDVSGIVESQNLVGSLHLYLGEDETALQLYFKSIELAEQIKNPYLISVTYNHIAVAYQSQKKNDLAIENFKKSLQFAEKSGTENQILNNLYKLGVIYETLDSLSQAYKYYKRSFLIEENNKNAEGMFYSLLGIGSVSAKRKDYYQAYVIYNKAKEIADRLEVLAYKMLVFRHLGELFLREKKFLQAREMFLNALNVADSLEFNKEKRDCYINLAATNENLKFYFDAYYYLARYVGINDTLFSQEANEKISLIQVKYDLHNKEKEIELLKQKEQKGILLRNTLLAGISLIGLLVFLMIYLYRTKNRHNRVLKERNNEIQLQKEEIYTNLDQLARVNAQLSQKNQQITESIEYALTVQKTILPGPNSIRNLFGAAFKIYLPRDIVSGDFYWLHSCKLCNMLVVADCTGHGIAGSLMSVIAHTQMNHIIEENPNIGVVDFLNTINNKIKTLFQHNSGDSRRYDEGMDMTVVRYDKVSKRYQIALANQVACIANEDGINVLQGDLYSIGGVFSKSADHQFKVFEFDANTKGFLYLFTDGIFDQMGGPENKKLMFIRLKEKLNSCWNKSPEIQKQELFDFYKQWKGDNKQTDDILIVGLKLHLDKAEIQTD